MKLYWSTKFKRSSMWNIWVVQTAVEDLSGKMQKFIILLKIKYSNLFNPLTVSALKIDKQIWIFILRSYVTLTAVDAEILLLITQHILSIDSVIYTCRSKRILHKILIFSCSRLMDTSNPDTVIANTAVTLEYS